MTGLPESIADLLQGSLLAGPWPLNLRARLCDLRPRFLPKGQAGRGHRAIARNGRVLLASDRPVVELAGRAADVRLQTWHRVVLPGCSPEPRGVLICVRCLDRASGASHTARMVRAAGGAFDLALDIGGGMALVFRRELSAEGTSPCPFSGGSQSRGSSGCC